MRPSGLHMDSKKVKAIYYWPKSRNATEVINFNGIANFYRKVIKGFSETSVLKKKCMKAQRLKWNNAM